MGSTIAWSSKREQISLFAKFKFLILKESLLTDLSNRRCAQDVFGVLYSRKDQIAPVKVLRRSKENLVHNLSLVIHCIVIIYYDYLLVSRRLKIEFGVVWDWAYICRIRINVFFLFYKSLSCQKNTLIQLTASKSKTDS